MVKTTGTWIRIGQVHTTAAGLLYVKSGPVPQGVCGHAAVMGMMRGHTVRGGDPRRGCSEGRGTQGEPQEVSGSQESGGHVCAVPRPLR
ncbi:hypothetical protein GDO81_009633 [Engystomops pustulosus]|uniref:Uncharacterized protein n=1 Tax=Engystomops pustulosus TaxID=76066 RepID=A0AAV7BTG3_ENGPU|nr:hypothetical protein GDO81_009633 [Engystomops pustulosus]